MATCWSCGKRKLVKNDNLCHGCRHVVCVKCVERYEHFGANGLHGRRTTKREPNVKPRRAAKVESRKASRN